MHDKRKKKQTSEIMGKQIIEAMVDGGRATPGPPLGPSLAPLKVNTKKVVDDINKKTAGLSGMKVPVKIIVNTDTKEYTIDVGTPPTAAIMMKELKLEKASPTPGSRRVGDLNEEQVHSIALTKFGSESDRFLTMVRGTARSLGVTIGQGPITTEELKRYEEIDRQKAAAAAGAAADSAAPAEVAPAEKPAKAAKPTKQKPGKK